MLVLARNAKEGKDTIVIGDNVVIQILEIKGNTVRVGIAAPNEVRINRGEIDNQLEKAA
tara:strand:+ start:690 stop:866 length:177 start_codon:yes stop_codon:yes gene_type:complete